MSYRVVNDRLSKLIYYSSAYTFEYNSDNQINKSVNTDGRISTYEYDTQGRWIKALTLSGSDTLRYTVTYDSNGNRSKMVLKSSRWQVADTTIYRYANGNLILIDKGSFTISYEYYLDRENPLKSQEDKLSILFLDGIAVYNDGTANKNLRKKQTYSDNGYTEEYVYEFNDNGYYSKKTTLSPNLTTNTTYEYQCK